MPIHTDIDGVFSTPSAPKTSHTSFVEHTPAAEILTWGSKPLSLGDGLNQIKADANKFVRFALIKDVNPEQAQTHFTTLNGKRRSYLCSGPGCSMLCASGDQPSHLIVALSLAYTNADPTTAKLASGASDYKIGYLTLSVTTLNMILEAPITGSTPIDIDYAMTFDGRRYSFQMVGTQARYIRDGDEAKVQAMAEPFKRLLRGKLGTAIPAGATVQSASVNDYD